MTIRRATAQDVPALAALYESTVRAMGPSRYSPQQVEVWASFAREPAFADFVLTAATFVAECRGAPVGFCGLLSTGRIASLYVSERYSRRGIAGDLLRRVIRHAQARRILSVHTEASEFSRPVFVRNGFVLDAVEQVERGGVCFHRYRMVRAVDPSDGPADQ
jgi:putative acetyltransferase